MLKFDLTKPLPKSHDGKEAVRCDAMGNPSPKGKHIQWTELKEGATVPQQRIAKLYRPEVIDKVDWHGIERETQQRPERYDPRLYKPRKALETRTKRVIAKFGGPADAFGKIVFSRDTQMVSWCQGTHPDEEYLMIHPWFVRQKMQYVYWMVLQQHVHRALCRGRDHLADDALRNLVMDICANRMLAATATGRASKSFAKFARWIYPDSTKQTVLALCNPNLDDYDLKMLRRTNFKYAQLWEKLYKPEKGRISLGRYVDKRGVERERTKKVDGMLSFAFEDMNPDDLYFELKNQMTWDDYDSIRSFKDGGFNPFGDTGWDVHLSRAQQAALRVGANQKAPSLAQRIERSIRRHMVPPRFRRALNWREPGAQNTQTKFWDAWIVDPEHLDSTSLEEYARKIHTRKVMDDITGTICRAYMQDQRRDPYPHHLSEEGINFIALGLTYPVYPLFLNAEGTNNRRRLVAFFDLSPSMQPYIAYMCDMCRTVQEVMDVGFARNSVGDSGAIGFAEAVMPMTHEEFAKMQEGDVALGEGTSFDDLVEYCNTLINTDDVDAVICFTDGQSDLTQKNIDAFNRSGKMMYRVYFRQWKSGIGHVEAKSPLDELNGISWTLTLPPTDKFALITKGI